MRIKEGESPGLQLSNTVVSINWGEKVTHIATLHEIKILVSETSILNRLLEEGKGKTPKNVKLILSAD